MQLWHAVVLGIVEGFSEYRPVSSTGHLLLAQNALGIGGGDAANAYAICIQAGAIAAVLGLYYQQVREMVLGLFGKSADGRRLLINVMAGFLPAAVIGGLFDKKIEHYLFGLWPIVFAWLAGGIVILLWARR